VLIEDTANGPAIISELRADPDFGIPVGRIKPKSSTDSRACASSSDVEAGSVLVPGDAPWIGPVIVMFSQRTAKAPFRMTTTLMDSANSSTEFVSASLDSRGITSNSRQNYLASLWSRKRK